MSKTIVKHCLSPETTNGTSKGFEWSLFCFVSAHFAHDPYLGQPSPWRGRGSLHMAKDRGSSVPQSSKLMWEPWVSKSYEYNRPLFHIHIKTHCYIFYISEAGGCPRVWRGIRRNKLSKYRK